MSLCKIFQKTRSSEIKNKNKTANMHYISGFFSASNFAKQNFGSPYAIS